MERLSLLANSLLSSFNQLRWYIFGQTYGVNKHYMRTVTFRI